MIGFRTIVQVAGVLGQLSNRAVELHAVSVGFGFNSWTGYVGYLFALSSYFFFYK